MPAAAAAFSSGSAATKGCHEDITTEAWRLRAQYPEQGGALPTRGEDQALIDDVPFKVPKSIKDIGGTTLEAAGSRLRIRSRSTSIVSTERLD